MFFDQSINFLAYYFMPLNFIIFYLNNKNVAQYGHV
ncbi:hypothetical protein F950_01700 [Acinetobacter soli NIPH 2899]|uniref:Uncharacterized protein n=1 Tax=Acinetobacter soli NIPH 2899 TaxID=1217677 RepID=A0ABN0JY23_9GAMM|nr:hypothetical protein F950_01700 [Acinetobacter soli NIPH 2899]